MADKTKIVMIDDEEDLCLMVSANLEDKGYEVATLSDPTQAESFIKQENPDIILLDVVMPQRKGSEVVEALKKDKELKNIPIIMVSGKGEMVYNKKKEDFKWVPNSKVVKDRGDLPDAKGSEALSDAYQVNDYVSKPFSSDLLVQVIEDVLKTKRKSGGSDEAEKEPGV